MTRRAIVHEMDAWGFCITCGEPRAWLLEQGQAVIDR